MKLLQSDQQFAVDDAADDITAGNVILDSIGALVNIDRMGSGQDILERCIHRGVTLLDRNRGSGAEGFPGSRQGNVRQGVDDIAEIVTTSRVDMCRVRRIPALLRSHTKASQWDQQDSDGKPNRDDQRRSRRYP